MTSAMLSEMTDSWMVTHRPSKMVGENRYSKKIDHCSLSLVAAS